MTDTIMMLIMNMKITMLITTMFLITVMIHGTMMLLYRSLTMTTPMTWKNTMDKI